MDKKIGLILILLVFTIFSSVQAFSIAFCDNGVLEAGEFCDFGGSYNLTNSTYCFNLNQCDLIAASFCFENPSYSDETRMIDSLNNLWIGGAWSNVSNLTGSSFVDKRLIEHYSMGIPGGFRYCEYRNCEQGYSPVDGECVEGNSNSCESEDFGESRCAPLFIDSILAGDFGSILDGYTLMPSHRWPISSREYGCYWSGNECKSDTNFSNILEYKVVFGSGNLRCNNSCLIEYVCPRSSWGPGTKFCSCQEYLVVQKHGREKWIRGLGYVDSGLSPEVLNNLDLYSSSLSCDYFHVKDSREYITLEGIILVLEQIESEMESKNLRTDMDSMLKNIFFYGYLYHMQGANYFGEDTNWGLVVIPGYLRLFVDFKLNLEKYVLAQMILHQHPEFHNADQQDNFKLNSPMLLNLYGSEYLRKYCTSPGLINVNCSILPPKGYLNKLDEAMLKRIHITGIDTEFSLTHLSQVYVSSWSNFNKIIDSTGTAKNWQNYNGNVLGVVAKEFWQEDDSYSSPKLSVFLKCIKSEVDSSHFLPEDGELVYRRCRR